MKYKGLGRASAKGAAASFAGYYATLLPVGTTAQAAVGLISYVLFAVSCAAGTVWLFLNAAQHGGEQEPERLPAAGTGDYAAAAARVRQAFTEGTSPAGDYEAAMDAIHRGVLEGTFSVNGQRYAGPPPASFRRVFKSECDGCGMPLGAAWCPPAIPYLCGNCLFTGQAGW